MEAFAGGTAERPPQGLEGGGGAVTVRGGGERGTHAGKTTEGEPSFFSVFLVYFFQIQVLKSARYADVSQAPGSRRSCRRINR